MADYSVKQIPVMIEYLKSVMKETEDAALKIGENLRLISANGSGSSRERGHQQLAGLAPVSGYYKAEDRACH